MEWIVIRGLFGPNTVVGDLRASLDDQSVRHRAISDKVANLLTGQANGGFAADLNRQLTEVETEQALTDSMVALADTSLRYDVAARLLQRTYQQFRTAIRER
jgi:hypothetical protein